MPSPRVRSNGGGRSSPALIAGTPSPSSPLCSPSSASTGRSVATTPRGRPLHRGASRASPTSPSDKTPLRASATALQAKPPPASAGKKARLAPSAGKGRKSTARRLEVQAALLRLCQGSGCSQVVAMHALLVNSGEVVLAQSYLARSSDGSPPWTPAEDALVMGGSKSSHAFHNMAARHGAAALVARTAWLCER